MNDEEQFVSENYNLFNFIFDAASIRQYLGGVDTLNIAGDTKKIINKISVIKYNNYNITFENKKQQLKHSIVKKFQFSICTSIVKIEKKLCAIQK